MAAIRAARCSALVALLAACAADPIAEPASPVTAETEVAPVTGSPAAPGPTVPPTTEQPVATTFPRGLPSQLPVPPADVITLGGDSTSRVAFTVRGVPLAEVEAWVLDELARLDWDTGEPTDDPSGGRSIGFTGPGAAGTLRLVAAEPDVVDAVAELGARPT